MTTGTAGALEIALSTLCAPGKTVLLPCPGYSLFRCLCGALGINFKFYKLLVSL